MWTLTFHSNRKISLCAALLVVSVLCCLSTQLAAG